ncbi:MAG: hypothetical protein PHY72_01395 [Candidatus Pacebacteria bacterium]|nr:hypothetical protein [Candidatus Paceibacterota bacterium]
MKKGEIFLVVVIIGLLVAALFLRNVIKVSNPKESLPSVVWSQGDYPDQIMASFEKRKPYFDVRELADNEVRRWYRNNPEKEITATSLTVILTVSDRKER